MPRLLQELHAAVRPNVQGALKINGLRELGVSLVGAWRELRLRELRSSELHSRAFCGQSARCCLGPSGGGSCMGSGFRQGLINVPQDIVDRFNAHRQPDQIGRYARRDLLRFG